ncbi:hypothetical protein ACLB2K_062255 [Fragaria x ananassa]
MKPLVFPKTQHLHVSQVVYVTGGEVGAAISVAPKKIGYDIAWDMKVSVVRLIPYAAALVIKAGAAASYHYSNHQAASNTRMGSKDEKSIKWTPPPPGVVKINFDGSVLQHSSGAAVGFVLRDDAGCPVVVVAHCIGKTNVSVAEATTLREGLPKEKEMNIKNVTIKGDSSLVINCVNMKFKCL